jgi:hypothetical protein
MYYSICQNTSSIHLSFTQRCSKKTSSKIRPTKLKPQNRVHHSIHNVFKRVTWKHGTWDMVIRLSHVIPLSWIGFTTTRIIIVNFYVYNNENNDNNNNNNNNVYQHIYVYMYIYIIYTYIYIIYIIYT